MTPVACGSNDSLTPRDAVRLVETFLELLHVVGREQRWTARDELPDLWDAVADGRGQGRRQQVGLGSAAEWVGVREQVKETETKGRGE